MWNILHCTYYLGLHVETILGNSTFGMEVEWIVNDRAKKQPGSMPTLSLMALKRQKLRLAQRLKPLLSNLKLSLTPTSRHSLMTWRIHITM